MKRVIPIVLLMSAFFLYCSPEDNDSTDDDMAVVDDDMAGDDGSGDDSSGDDSSGDDSSGDDSSGDDASGDDSSGDDGSGDDGSGDDGSGDDGSGDDSSGDDDDGSNGGEITLINYSDDILPLFEGNCYNCHGPNPTSINAPDLFTFESVAGSANEISDRINARGNNDSMPPTGLLNPDVIAVFDQWIVDGLLEN